MRGVVVIGLIGFATYHDPRVTCLYDNQRSQVCENSYIKVEINDFDLDIYRGIDIETVKISTVLCITYYLKINDEFDHRIPL